MASVKEMIKLALQEAGMEAKEQIDQETATEKETEKKAESPKTEVALSLEYAADIIDEIEKTGEAIDKNASDLEKEAIGQIFTKPWLWALLGGAGAGAGAGALITSQIKKKQMGEQAKQMYGLGALHAAAHIKNMLMRGQSPAGMPKTSEVADYLRKTAEVLRKYEKREEAMKIACKMLDKGIISQDSFLEKVAELEKSEESLEVLDKAIDVQNFEEFGKLAEATAGQGSEPYRGGIYEIL